MFRRDDEGEDLMTTSLPPDFADLEPFSDWFLATEAERYAKRLSSSMQEMQSFYDVAFPRLEEILGYLDGLDLDALRFRSRYGDRPGCPTVVLRPWMSSLSQQSDLAHRAVLVGRKEGCTCGSA
jgi:hypothetical protein